MKCRRNSASGKVLAKVGGKTAVKALEMEVGIGEVMGAIDATPVVYEVAKEQFREGTAGAKRSWQAARQGEYRKAAKEAFSTGVGSAKRSIVGAGKTATAFFTSKEAADALMPAKKNPKSKWSIALGASPDGRRAYVIHRNGRPTGKYFFTKAKAAAYAKKQR